MNSYVAKIKIQQKYIGILATMRVNFANFQAVLFDTADPYFKGKV